VNPHCYLISRRVANPRLIRQVDRKRHRELLMVAVTALALAVAILAYAWQHFEMIRIGYQIEELRLAREHLLKTKRHLLLERASLTSADRIEAIAGELLDLEPPSASQVVVVERYHGQLLQGGGSR
jgi:cell division protein FtsL